MKKIVFIIIVFLLFCLAITANAWDGKRKGFLLGFGVGPVLTSYSQINWKDFKKERVTEVGFMTDFWIGYAPTDLIEIYYTNKVSWFGTANEYGNDITVANGLTGLGMTYYFRPEAPSPFIAGGFGLSSWITLSLFDDSSTPIGFGLFAGAGYEFTRHVNVELDFLWSSLSSDELWTDTNKNPLSVKLTLNVLGY